MFFTAVSIEEISTGLRNSKKWIESCFSRNARLRIEISEVKDSRSSAQNRYYFLFNTWVSDCLNDAGCTYGEYNIPYTKDLIHDINKQLFGFETTRKMSVSEFCEYITKVSQFWIERTNGTLEIPELPMSYLERLGYTEDYLHG